MNHINYQDLASENDEILDVIDGRPDESQDTPILDVNADRDGPAPIQETQHPSQDTTDTSMVQSKFQLAKS
jgi:hypothetical protein